MQGVQVRSLVGEKIPQMLCGAAKKKKKKFSYLSGSVEASAKMANWFKVNIRF